MQQLKQLLLDCFHLFYPHTCTGCGSDNLHQQNLLCARCLLQLPATQYARYRGNPVEKIFWGRLPLNGAFAEFYFVKDSLIQHLIHELKYKSNPDIGRYLGEMMGRSMQQNEAYKDVEALIPLPMFPAKERKRGYNQAAILCEGMSAILNIPVVRQALIRQELTETQTRKQRAERWQNVASSFGLKNVSAISGKHVLLVDDVITTGATLEAGGRCLLQSGEVKLSIATLATALK